MVSKSQIKLIKSLSQKKFRNIHKLFVVEGVKGINEFLYSDYELVSIYSTRQKFDVSEKYHLMVEERDLKKISFLKTPQEALAVFKIPEDDSVSLNGLTVALDGVRDPGNLGTIIRLCDWFGVENLICSKDTVDCYNTKVVQASMGSLTRVNVQYSDLKSFLLANRDFPIVGTLLEGDNIYKASLPASAIIIMGNEANGISEEIKDLISLSLNIPQFGSLQKTESLNVATATAVVLSEFRRG
ncbi:TrmH family RNA methyltransferase [Christiangramia sabulilitoris]|uniref:RNA methyltransferase n=1 Tax=Christiangramia sabulilitoris TaxID=2583991 RepID=A0A550HZ86_9FLAO|nr:RNA methyltransferase [Christiangramia sabulilitoris]TRO64053.1 RNA methyltransferase [Christiangramia sabulilitoris]